MTVTLTWQSVITAAAIVGAIVALANYLKKVFGFVDRQQQQDKDIAAIKEELKVLTYGTLACLKGLHEQGCNGPVTDAIKELEKHLNKEAHK